MKCQRNQSSEQTVTRSFEAFDTKGRQFGARVYMSRVDYFECSPVAHSYYERPAPVRGLFAWTPQATRGGDNYGACQSTNECATAEQRDAEVAAYFKGAEKRAMKNKSRAARPASQPSTRSPTPSGL